MASPTEGVGARGDAGARAGAGTRGGGARDGAGESRGVGARLRSARERAGLSPIQVAEKLHIEIGALEALEAEQFELLGAPVYVRGYLRHYADLVGESATELQDLYAASAHAARMPDLTHIPKVEGARTSGPLLLPGVVVVIAVAAIGTAWWISGNVGSSRLQRAGIVTPSPARSGGARAVGLPAAGQARVSGAVPRSQPRPASTTPRADVAPAAQGGALASVPRGPGQLAAPGQPSGAAAAQASAGPHPRVSVLKMHFTEDSWTEVYDARGERLFYDVGFAGSTRTVRGVPPLRILLGNPPEVALQLDGRPVAVPQAARNVITEFRVNRSGRVAPMRLAAAERRGSDDRKRANLQVIN